MGKSKKNFWKQMYLSNGWAIDKIVVTGVRPDGTLYDPLKQQG